MTNKQKLWLWISLGLFVIPEILWSPILGLLPFNKTFTNSADNHFLFMLITLLEFIGILGAFVLICRLQIKKTILINLSLIALAALGLWAFYIFYLLFATLHMWS
jgi:hypothetical protein